MCGTDTACGCSTTTATSSAPAAEAGGVQQVYQVTGMTCGGCASRVSKQLAEIDGVSDVSVNVATGAVTVTSATPLDTDTVKASVAQAGYQLLG
jgi:copper chaperone CopZ